MYKKEFPLAIFVLFILLSIAYAEQADSVNGAIFDTFGSIVFGEPKGSSAKFTPSFFTSICPFNYITQENGGPVSRMRFSAGFFSFKSRKWLTIINITTHFNNCDSRLIGGIISRHFTNLSDNKLFWSIEYGAIFANSSDSTFLPINVKNSIHIGDYEPFNSFFRVGTGIEWRPYRNFHLGLCITAFPATAAKNRLLLSLEIGWSLPLENYPKPPKDITPTTTDDTFAVDSLQNENAECKAINDSLQNEIDKCKDECKAITDSLIEYIENLDTVEKIVYEINVEHPCSTVVFPTIRVVPKEPKGISGIIKAKQPCCLVDIEDFWKYYIVILDDSSYCNGISSRHSPDEANNECDSLNDTKWVPQDSPYEDILIWWDGQTRIIINNNKDRDVKFKFIYWTD